MGCGKIKGDNIIYISVPILDLSKYKKIPANHKVSRDLQVSPAPVYCRIYLCELRESTSRSSADSRRIDGVDNYP